MKNSVRVSEYFSDSLLPVITVSSSLEILNVNKTAKKLLPEINNGIPIFDYFNAETTGDSSPDQLLLPDCLHLKLKVRNPNPYILEFTRLDDSSFICILIREEVSFSDFTHFQQSILPLVKTMQEGVIIMDLKGIMQFANNSALSMLEIGLEQIIGVSVLDARWKTVHVDGSEFSLSETPVMETLKSLMPTRNTPMGIYKVSGEVAWISINTNILKNDLGEAYAVMAVFTDITDLKNLEKKLFHTIEFIGSVFDKLPGYVYQVKDDQFSTPVFISKNIEELTGYSESEFTNGCINYLDLIHPEDKEIILKEIEYSQKNNLPYDCDYRIITKERKIKWVKEKANLKADQDDKNWIGLVIDITVKKNAEHALLKRKEELKKLLNALPVAMYTTDSSGVINFYNKEAANIWGREPVLNSEKWCGSYKLYDRFLNPIRHEECPMGIAIRDKISMQGVEAVLEQPNGKMIHFLAHATPFFSKTGEFEGAMNVMVDITDRIKIESRLLSAESEFRAFADNAPIAMCMFDANGEILMENKFSISTFVDPASSSHTGIRCLFGKTLWESVLDSNNKVLSGNCELTYEKTAYINNKFWYFQVHKFPVKNHQTNSLQVGAIYMDITELKKQENELSLKENRLRSLLESNTSYLIRINQRGIVTYHNQSFASLIGEDAASINNRIFLLKVSPEDHVHVFNLIHECIKSPGKIYSLNLKIESHDTWLNTFWEFVGIHDVFGKVTEIQAVGWNITEMVKQQEEINKLAHIIKRTQNGVVITDLNGVMEWANEGFLMLTEYSNEELMHQVPGHLLQGEESSRETIRYIKKCMLDRKGFNVDLINYSKSNRKYWVNIDAEPIVNEEGEVVKYMAIETDITEKKEQEIILHQLVNDLIIKNKNLEEFSYIVSHNLRGPVANILGLVNLTRYELTQEDIKSIIESLHKSTIQLDLVIKDVNQILSLQNIAEIKESISLRELSHEVLESFADDLNLLDHEIINEIPDNFSIKSVRPYLHSIFYNILSNAIKYRHPDRKLQISILVKQEEAMLHIFFSDNGIGLDIRKFKDKIFGLYKRFHLNIEGKGMGLFITKQQIEILGGKINVQSTPNNGAVFVISLPIQ